MAADYETRTGRWPGDLTPAQLMFRVRAIRERERIESTARRREMAAAVSFALAGLFAKDGDRPKLEDL